MEDLLKTWQEQLGELGVACAISLAALAILVIGGQEPIASYQGIAEDQDKQKEEIKSADDTMHLHCHFWPLPCSERR